MDTLLGSIPRVCDSVGLGQDSYAARFVWDFPSLGLKTPHSKDTLVWANPEYLKHFYVRLKFSTSDIWLP